MAPRTIISIRHPQCAHNVRGGSEYLGYRSNPPVTRLGQQQLQRVRQRLHAEFYEEELLAMPKHASTLTRTHELPKLLPGTYQEFAGLDERNSGVFQIYTRSELRNDHPKVYKNFAKLFTWGYRPQHGQSCADVTARIVEYLETEVYPLDVETLLISGHGLSGLCLHQALTDEPVHETEERLQRDRLKNVSWSAYEQVRGTMYSCIAYNDTSHLGGM